MKKIKIFISTCICLCFCLMGGVFLVACSPEEEFDPYITISGLSTSCAVGGELDYSNAKILYYTNLEDTIPDEYPLTRDMVSGFSSDTAGTRTMIITFKTYTTEVDYKVIALPEPPIVEINPYIKVSGLSTSCVVGGELDYSNAEILYYENLTDEIPDEYPLTRDMVSGFSSDTAGTRTLTATYKIYEAKIDYKVLSDNEFIQIFNKAVTKLKNISNAKLTMQFGSSSVNETTVIINDELYQKNLDMVGNVTECWILKENSEFYKYEISKDYTVKSKVENYKPSNQFIYRFFGDDVLGLSSSNFNEVISNYSYKKLNNKETVSFYYIGMGAQQGEFPLFVYDIEDGQFTQFVATYGNDSMSTNFSYDVSNEEIPALPENVEFKIEASEVISAYNAAIANLNNEDSVACQYMNKSTSKGYTLYNGEVIYIDHGIANRCWYYQDSTYKIGIEADTKESASNNLKELLAYQALSFTDLKVTEEDLATAVCTVKYTIDGIVYKIVYSEEDTAELTIKDGLFTKLNHNVNTQENSMLLQTYIYYEERYTSIPSLPEDVEFKIEASEVISAYNAAIANLNNENAVTCTYLNNGINAGVTYYDGEVIYMDGGISKRWYYEDASYWTEDGTNTKYNESNDLKELLTYQVLAYSGLKVTEEDLATATCTAKYTANGVIYKIVYSDEYTAELTIKDGLFIKVSHDINKVESEMFLESLVAYTVDESKIVELPDVSWKEST